MTPPRDRTMGRWLALECARVVCAALSQLTREAGALAAHLHLDEAKRVAGGDGAVLAELMRDAVMRAERGAAFADGKAWRRAA